VVGGEAEGIRGISNSEQGISNDEVKRKEAGKDKVEW